MKMRDVFELPVECIGTEIEDQFCKVFDAYILRPYDSNDAIESAKAAAHAINMYDDLVDAFDCVLTCWLEDCDPSELEIVVSKSLSILSRAKGQFTDAAIASARDAIEAATQTKSEEVE